MATVQPTLSHRASDARVTSFALTATNRDGAPQPNVEKREVYISVTGTWDGATVVLQGSNDGTNWFTMANKAGTGISFTANGGGSSTDVPLFIRPYVSVAGGGSADLTAIIVQR